MPSLDQLDLHSPTPCVEHLLAPVGLHLCRCDQHGACSATRVLAAAELTRLWATAGHDDESAATLARAIALTTGVVDLEGNVGLLAELLSARNLRFGEALAVTLAVMGLESQRPVRAA